MTDAPAVRHLVNRLRFDIRCSDEQEAFDVRANLGNVMQEVVREALDEVCSKHVGENETVTIDRIELDLGRISRNAIERELGAAVRSRFEAALVDCLTARMPGTRRQPTRASRLELFGHVMSKGTLPWWQSEDFDIDALACELATNLTSELRAFLYAHASHQVLWLRMASQLGDVARAGIIELIPALKATEERTLDLLGNVASDLENVTGRFAANTRTQAAALVREAVLRRAPALIALPEDDALMADLADELVALADESTGDLTRALRERLAHAKHEPRPQSQPAEALGAAEHDSVRTSTAIESEETEPSERYVVRHSGVILFAPFFESFFTACGLRAGRLWESRAAQYTAAHLLRYLCTGQQECAEHALTLEKVCCGIALDEPIPRRVPLRVEQIAEADALLASVLEHWKALKNTSIPGLRATFLERDGILTRREEDWLLRVERKTVDVLIDSVPWGYSTVAMPWNAYVIHVEW